MRAAFAAGGLDPRPLALPGDAGGRFRGRRPCDILRPGRPPGPDRPALRRIPFPGVEIPVSSTRDPAHSAPRSVEGTESEAPPGAPPSVPPGAAVGGAWTRERLERVRARDPGALAEFFERHFDQVYGLVHRLLGDRAAAEDVTQEVFYKVQRSIHQLDAGRDPAPWLMAIAHNACRDVWRSGAYRMSRRSASVDDDPVVANRLASPTPDPEGAAVLGERERLVRQAIAELPEPLRVAVVLHDYQGLNHQEVARITGIGHAAARKRYSRALSALAKLLEERLR